MGTRKIGDVLRQAREKAEMTQTNVANRLLVTRQYISNLERSKHVSQNMIITLCVLYGLSKETIKKIILEQANIEDAVKKKVGS